MYIFYIIWTLKTIIEENSFTHCSDLQPDLQILDTGEQATPLKPTHNHSY